ncbi:MAG: hypothetical protein HKN24_08810 [Acidimicrobiales bacterium]|nr:hypothetical protein [Acidimicrobiales bacterium]
MSRSLRWIRAYLGESLIVSIVVTSVIGTLSSYTFITLRSGLEPIAALPWAFVLGQIFALTRLAVAVTTNPLSYRFLAGYIQSPYSFEPLHVPNFDPDNYDLDARSPYPSAGVSDALTGWKLTRTITVHDPEAAPSPVFDLFHSPSGVVLAAVSQVTGSLALMTELDDGRILHTTDLLVPPHPSMVVNTVVGAPMELARAHTRLLAMLMTLDINPSQTGVRVFADVMAAEHAAYSDLGPLLGSVLNIDGRISPNLSYGVDTDDLLERTLL